MNTQQQNMLFWGVALAVIIGIGILLYIFWPQTAVDQNGATGTSTPPTVTVNTFAECQAAGYTVMESYPRRCTTPDGASFTEPIADSDVNNFIRVDAPTADSVVTSPLTVSGQARGTWYFEASFPVKLLDASGKIIAQAPAQAQGDWMTEEFVPFSVALTFTKPTSTTGTLVLEKDNPSGLPEFDNELRIPVIFDSAAAKAEVKSTALARNGCVVSGCSGQLCGEEEQTSTCEYRPEYACYKTAVCERQPDDQCAWTLDVELLECLNNSAQ